MAGLAFVSRSRSRHFTQYYPGKIDNRLPRRYDRPMDKIDRKAAQAAYKDQKTAAGVCAIRCAAAGRV